jgi:hypothetical protein
VLEFENDAVLGVSVDVVLKIRSLSLLLNCLLGFEVVVQCEEKLDALLDSLELGLGMNTLTHMYMGQILRMDHP